MRPDHIRKRLLRSCLGLLAAISPLYSKGVLPEKEQYCPFVPDQIARLRISSGKPHVVRPSASRSVNWQTSCTILKRILAACDGMNVEVVMRAADGKSRCSTHV